MHARFPHLVLKNIPHRAWSHRIAQARKVIGRALDADICIPARLTGASRRHAEVWGDRYGTWLRDLGSRRGTSVNGVWIDHVPQVQIVVGDTLWLGGAELEVIDHFLALGT